MITDTDQFPVGFNVPILPDAYDTDEQTILNTNESTDDSDVVVRYKTYNQRDPHMRVKWNPDDSDDKDWYNFRITNRDKCACATPNDLDTVPADVLSAVYACGYYMPDLDRDDFLHILTHLSKTVDTIENMMDEYEHIPLLHRPLLPVHGGMINYGTLLAAMNVVGEDVFEEGINQLFEEKASPILPDDLLVILDDISDTDVFEDYVDGVDSTTPAPEHAESIAEGDAIGDGESEATIENEYADDSEDGSEDKLDIFDFEERHNSEILNVKDVADGDLLITYISPFGVFHVYLSHQKESNYVCEQPSVNHLDPVIMKAIKDHDRDITIVNMDTVPSADNPVDLIDHSMSVNSTIKDYFPGDTKEIIRRADDHLRECVLPAVAYSTEPEIYANCNEKAKQTYVEQIDERPFEDISAGHDEFEMLHKITYSVMPSDALETIHDELKEQIRTRRNFHSMRDDISEIRESMS